MICPFLTNDSIYKYISNMVNNLTPYSIAKGKENLYLLTPHFKFIEKEKFKNNELFRSIGNSVDPFDRHVLYCGKYSFKEIRL